MSFTKIKPKNETILEKMEKFKAIQLHAKTKLVKDSDYGFTLYFYDGNNNQIGDITIYTDTKTHEIKTISIAFNRKIRLKILEPSWNGIILSVLGDKNGN
ncbi:MAG: hypothetical protein DRJ03_21770 [Chloroflexi bacterium]|nr:MAG: hypothetical protein DRJ03_21770 [Chloroflexota bacterium]